MESCGLSAQIAIEARLPRSSSHKIKVLGTVPSKSPRSLQLRALIVILIWVRPKCPRGRFAYRLARRIRSLQKAIHMTSGFQAILLILSLKYELEHCKRDLATVQNSIKRWCMRGMHGKRMVTMIIVTEESVAEIGARLRPVVGGADSIENFWMLLAPKPNDVSKQNGNFDSAVHWIRQGWVEAWERNKLQHVRKFQRRNASFKQRDQDR